VPVGIRREPVGIIRREPVGIRREPVGIIRHWRGVTAGARISGANPVSLITEESPSTYIRMLHFHRTAPPYGLYRQSVRKSGCVWLHFEGP
jgi:hypothetical protein